METKSVLAIAAVAMLALVIGPVQAESINVPNGNIALYKPGTDYTVTAVFGPAGNSYAKGVGDGITLSGGEVTYGDGSGTGTTIDCPGWVQIEGTAINDLAYAGFDGTDGSTAYSSFGGWSGGNGCLAESSDSLGRVSPGATYTISAMVNGSGFPPYFELLAGGVEMTPSSSVTPLTADWDAVPEPVVFGTDGWEVISRTYDADAIAAFHGEHMTIVMGCMALVPDPGPDDYLGGRLQYDNITLEFDRNPTPKDGEIIMVDENLELSWSNWSPVDGNDVYVDVWFGTEPNEMSGDYDMDKIVVAGKNIALFQFVDVSEPDTYYWQVNTYINGPDKIDDANMIEGDLWSFESVEDFAPAVEIVTLDKMTWSGEGVPLDATVTDDAVSAVTAGWTADDDSLADPNLTIDIVYDGDPPDATVTITKTYPTGNVATVTMTLAATDGGNPTPGIDGTASIEIDVYDDACHLARVGQGKSAVTDFNVNCITGLGDLVVMVEAWLDNYASTGPVVRP